MKIKTNTLIGPALDWAVDKALHLETPYHKWGVDVPHYSTNWLAGGEIIEREEIDLNCSHHEGSSGEMWDAACEVGKVFGGPTPLVAAMRAYVASKMGGEIEVPEELR